MVIWDQDQIRPGKSTLYEIVKSIKNSDFAILIFSPDDRVTSKDATQDAPRDNIVHELGLCQAQLGIERTFVVIPNDPAIKLPSNIMGITLLKYDAHRRRESLKSATATACHIIRNTISSFEPLSKITDRSLAHDPLPSLRSDRRLFGDHANRVVALFDYESGGGFLGQMNLWKEPASFWDQSYQTSYETWARHKCKLRTEDVLGTWFKVAFFRQEDGEIGSRAFRLELKGSLNDESGEAEESRLYAINEDPWRDEWRLENGLLIIRIGANLLTVVGSKRGRHSGVEDGADGQHSGFFRLGRVQSGALMPVE